MIDKNAIANGEIDKRIESTVTAMIAELYNEPDKKQEILDRYRERLARIEGMRTTMTDFLKP